MAPRQSTRSKTAAGIAIVAVLVVGIGCSRNEHPTGGVVVESCEPGEAAAVSGLQPGDSITEWRQGSANGDVDSILDLSIVEQELAPFGPVELSVVRESKSDRVVIPTGRWRIDARPTLEPPETEITAQARELERCDDLAGAAEKWADLAKIATGKARPTVSSWAHLHAAVVFAKAGRHEDSLSELDSASRSLTNQRQRAAFFERAGNALLEAGQNAQAADAFGNAITILEEDLPSSPALAHALLQLCRTDLRACDHEADRALGIYNRNGAATIEVAIALNTLGAVHFFRSDLDTAEARYVEALEIAHDPARASPTELNILGNLGLVAMKRGDFDTAQSYFKREQAAAELLSIDCIPYAYASNYLGLLAKNLGRYDEAYVYYQQALRAFQATRPEGFEIAGVLTNLGTVAQYRGDLATARAYHEEALRLRLRHDSESTSVASSLHNVGSIAWRQGDIDVGRTSLEKALSLKRDVQQNSLWIASSQYELGELTANQGALDEAAEFHRAALDIRRRVAPAHPDVIASLMALARIESSRDRPDRAETLLHGAVDLIEEQRRRLTISEQQRAQFKARYRMAYIDLAECLVDQGRLHDAWNILEQARAGALRAVVNRRDSIPEGVPRDLWFARARTETGIARAEARLALLDPGKDKADLAKHREQLSMLETRLDEIAAAIQESAPAIAELEIPRAFNLEQVRQALDPGTLVLTYSVGLHRTMAMMTTAAGGGFEIRSFRVPVGEEAFKERVERFNAFIARGASTLEIEGAFRSQAAKLSELLLAPAWNEIRDAEKILIVPDGPLHELPFAALAAPDVDGGFFGLARPIFVNPSATTAVELGRLSRRQRSEMVTVTAFGDPVYPPNSRLATEVDLGPLPGSRAEVESIQRLFGRKATAFVGSNASEANFRTHHAEATILHCALHARSDPRSPMDSALYFSFPSKPTDPENDGVVSAWDVVDDLRVGADTVVLSSCSTARGRVISGEGVIGLARAFHVAGARTLVASQWPVPDHSTAELMTAFYEAVAGGTDTVNALHHARRVVASHPETAHPYHWASFQIRGDWR